MSTIQNPPGKLGFNQISVTKFLEHQELQHLPAASKKAKSERKAVSHGNCLLDVVCHASKFHHSALQKVSTPALLHSNIASIRSPPSSRLTGRFWRPGVQKVAKKKLLGVATKTHDIRDETGPDAHIVRQQQQADRDQLGPSVPNYSKVRLYYCSNVAAFQY